MERRWELSLDGGMLTYDSLRCPQLGDRDAGAQEDPRAAFENDLFLRIADMEDAGRRARPPLRRVLQGPRLRELEQADAARASAPWVDSLG
jgi:hypothetical protein